MVSDLARKFRIYGLKQFAQYAFSETLRTAYWGMVRRSYSQIREDIAIDKFLGFRENGFYVDVGAHDPHRFSNTKRFYNRGWSGINIEPNRQAYLKFQKCRPRDTNLNIGVSSAEGMLTFFNLSPATLSTFSEPTAKEYQNQGFEIISRESVPVKPLAAVLDTHARNKKIDFLSIDTEGYDLEVLKGNDWKRYRPELICIETATHGKNAEDAKEGDQCGVFLQSEDYMLVFHNGLNSLYQDKRKQMP